ncbi:MAG: HAD hydrolase family protein [Candidatus Methanospirareceae archaeon]
MRANLIFFDLEGPLSPQDNAYEVMKLTGERGAILFEAISKYDDFIALEGREGYEPGDTLALITPFLVLHDITEEDIRKTSDRAKIVEGAKYLIERLRAENWEIYIISTSYEQHAYNIGRKLGIEEERIACTHLDLEGCKEELKGKEGVIEEVEEEIINLYSAANFSKMTERLDRFFFKDLPSMGYDVFKTRVVGGERKVEAMKRVLKEKDRNLRDSIAVGDSITDYKMLEAVMRGGGIAVVFNGNEYAVPYANVGLASVDIRFLYIVCNAFVKGKGEVMRVVSEWEDKRGLFEKEPDKIPEDCITEDIKSYIMERGKTMPFPYFHNLEAADERKKEEVIRIHKGFRMKVREEAGKLG